MPVDQLSLCIERQLSNKVSELLLAQTKQIMDLNELRMQLNLKYDQFVIYLNSLHPEEFTRKSNNKWTAGQQLDHILRSVKPLAKVVSNKAFIKENFGTLERPVWKYNKLVNTYQKALEEGGKASGKYIPEEVTIDKRYELATALLEDVKLLTQALTIYSEEELNQLIIPHPLLGKLAIREMLYFTIYHVGHHEQHIKKNIT